ncbi:MAG: flagellar hook-associated protein FlgK [Myxococcota bacterium]
MATLQEIFSISSAGINAGRNTASIAAFNIVNAQTPGFARRVSNLQTGATIGMGVIAGPAQAIRNTILARTLMGGQSRLGFHDAQLSALQVAEPALNDLDNSGINKALTDLRSALDILSATPAGTAERQGLIGAAKSLALTFATTSRQLTDAARAATDEARDVVGDINEAAKNVATLNARIRTNVSGEGDLVGLIDQRDQILTEMSNNLDIQVVSQKDGSVLVFAAGGRPLVTGTGASSFEVGPAGTPGSFEIGVTLTKPGGAKLDPLAPLGGRLGGLIEANNGVLGSQAARLDEIAFSFVSGFNTQHQSGTTPNGQPGGTFFEPISTVAGAARSIVVSAAIVADPSLIAGAGATPSGSTDNANFLALADLPNQVGVMADGSSIVGAYDAMVFNLAININNSETGSAIETASVLQIQTLIDSESAVNTADEEAKLVQARAAFDAASTVTTTVTNMLDTLLSMVG